MLYGPGDKRRVEGRSSINEFEKYFARGGAFYSSLERESGCKHWCTVFALSDPLDKDFYQECDHEHNEGDVMVEKFEDFFDQLIKDGHQLLRTTKITVEMPGPAPSAKEKFDVLHIRSAKATIRSTSGKVTKTVPWMDLRKYGLDDKSVNLLVLPDTVEKLRHHHRRYLNHLILDRNQTHGELQLKDIYPRIIELDHMMKPRAEQFKAGSQDFHIMMNKGSSCHAANLSQRVGSVPEDDEKKAGAEEDDCKHTIFLAFASSTAQDGYQTFCTTEATLKKMNELQPDIPDVVCCSDGGRDEPLHCSLQ